MLRKFKHSPGMNVFFGSLFLISVAVAGSILLGQVFISYLSMGQNKNNPTKEVNAVVEQKKEPAKNKIKLEAKPLYFVQAGVYSDLKSAETNAADLEKQGLTAYPNKNAPYKVYTGVYMKKETAAAAQKELETKNISSYVYSFVLNNSDMSIPPDKNVKDQEAMLKKFNEWLNKNIPLFEKNFAALDAGQFKSISDGTQVLYKSFTDELQGNKGELDWLVSAEKYQNQLKTLGTNWTAENFRAANLGLLETVSEYINWTQGFIDK